MITMRHFPVLLSWMLSLFFFVACTPEQTNARHEAMLDSAQVEILQNMDYNRAEMLYLTVIKETKNKLWRLLADEGMMKLCQIESKNKEFYDYRSDALKLMAELRTRRSGTVVVRLASSTLTPLPLAVSRAIRRFCSFLFISLLG